jgi:hypothetical protein
MTIVGDSSSAERALMVSSDGHATAQMREYRPFLDPGIREEFDAFCDRFDAEGMTSTSHWHGVLTDNATQCVQ